MPQNHYEGPVRRTTSLAVLNRALKDPDGIDELMFAEMVKGGVTFHHHPKTKVCYQIWTDERPGTVAFQKCIGWW